MMPDGALRPTRRSPLEVVHASLGARWVDDAARWPASYGDPDVEEAALTAAAGIADLGPIDKVLVRGPRSRQALEAAGITTVIGTVTAGGGAQAWCLADDEVQLLMPPPLASDPAESLGELVDRIGRAGAAMIDLGSGLSVLRIVGPASAAILARACAVDLSSRAVPDRGIVRAPVAGVRVVLARQDHPRGPGWTILVARDLAEYLWDALLELGSDLGLKPVGSDVARAGFVEGTGASA